MGRKPKTQTVENVEQVEEVVQPEPKPKKQISSFQAWETMGGNSRLNTYVKKVYTGLKTYDEWKGIFIKDDLK